MISSDFMPFSAELSLVFTFSTPKFLFFPFYVNLFDFSVSSAQVLAFIVTTFCLPESIAAEEVYYHYHSYLMEMEDNCLNFYDNVNLTGITRHGSHIAIKVVKHISIFFKRKFA